MKRGSGAVTRVPGAKRNVGVLGMLGNVGLGMLLLWSGCQAYELISGLPQGTGRQVQMKSEEKARWDAALISLSQGHSVFRHFIPKDRAGQYRILVELRPGQAFPDMVGLTRYGNVGQIYSASATPEALRELQKSLAIARAEAAPQYRLRRMLGGSSMLMHTSAIDPNGTPTTLTYKLTVPAAGQVTVKAITEAVTGTNGNEAQWNPVLELCPTAQCTNPSDRDYADFGKPDAKDPHATPQSHASLTHTFAQAGDVYLKISSQNNQGGKFVLLISSQDIDLAVSHLTDGDIGANRQPRRVGIGAGVVRKEQNIDGTGVLMAVVDSGLDWCHPDFVRSGNKSQVLFLWDQEMAPQGADTSPDANVVGQQAYGVEYTRQQIEAALNGCDRTKVRSQDTNGHGTHVAGIAAGGGTSPGIAPGADLIIVKGLNDIVSATKYILDKAKQLKRPVIINMSLGGHDTSHDGTSLGEKAIEQSIGPGINFAVAASNEGDKPLHAVTTVALNQPTTLRFQAKKDQNQLNLNIFTDKQDTYTIQLAGAGLNEALTWGQTKKDSTNDLDYEWGSGQAHAANPVLLRTYLVIKWKAALTQDTILTFTITRTQGTGNGQLDAYDVTEKGAFLDHLSKNADGSIKGTMASPGTSRGTMAVGAYNNTNVFDMDNKKFFPDVTLLLAGDLADFSSRGPTRDGRPGVTFATPGNQIESTMTGHIDECKKTPTAAGCKDLLDNYTQGKTYISQGTSMATPVAAGASALILQKDPTAFVRPLFVSTAQTPAWFASPPADMWGAGLLRLPDAYQKWSSGQAPQIKLEAEGGQTVGLVPFKVALKVSVQNGVNVREYFWNFDEKEGNEKIGDVPTESLILDQLGKRKVTVVAVADNGRTSVASLELEAVDKLPEHVAEATPSETTSQESQAGEEPVSDSSSTQEPGPESPSQDVAPFEPAAEPSTDSGSNQDIIVFEPSESPSTADSSSGQDATTTDGSKLSGGCSCDVGSSTPSPGHLFWLGALFFFFVRLKRKG